MPGAGCWSDPDGIIERMFGTATPKELIDAMGLAARAESAAIAQRLQAVAVLFQRRKRWYAEAGLVHSDVHVAVAA